MSTGRKNKVYKYQVFVINIFDYDEWLRFGESASGIALNGAEEFNFSAQDFVKAVCNVRK